MNKVYCRNCGQLIPEDSNFCWRCGASQRALEEAAGKTEERPKVEPELSPEEAAALEMLEATVKQRHLDPGAIWLFFINYIGKTAMVLPLFAVGIYLQPLVIVGFVIYLVLAFLIAILVFNHFIFDIEKDRLDIEYGIVHKRHVSVPFRQIQNVNITRSLIDRLLGIAKLEIESAGSSMTHKRDVVGGTKSKAEGFLPGLSVKDALTFHDMILQKAMHEQRLIGNLKND